jgi:olefin beta-lactone synthetase
MNLLTKLEQRALLHPDAIALCDRHENTYRRITFATLYQRVCGTSQQFRSSGLIPGQTIFLFHPIRIEFYILLLGAMHAGLVVMLADPSAGLPFIRQCCLRKNPDAFAGIRKSHILRWLIPPLRSTQHAYHDQGWIPFSKQLRETLHNSSPYSCENSHPALITFTSGSTGTPKAAVRTHGFLLAQHKVLAKALHHREGETDLVTLPVFCLANLASGLTSVLADMPFGSPAKANPKNILAQCHEHKVTRCAASPAFFEALLQGETPPFQSIYTGGAPVHPNLLERLSSALPNTSLTAVYGSTEAEPIAHCRDPDLTTLATAATNGQGLCAGIVVDEIKCRIIRDQSNQPIPNLTENDFSEMLCPTATTGEIVVSGDHVLPGYLDAIGDSETKFRVNDQIWHRTGDAGYFDQNSTLWLMGRCSAKINLHNGQILYPFAIECILRRRWPACRATIISHQGKNLLVAEHSPFIPKSDLETFALQHHLDSLILLPQIPLDKRHNAKIDYPALHSKLSSLHF